GEPARRAPRRTLQGRRSSPVAMERYLANGRRAACGRLGGRDADSVQNDLVQPRDGYMGLELEPPRGAYQRDDGLGIAEPDPEPGDLGRAHGHHGYQAGARTRRRAVALGRLTPRFHAAHGYFRYRTLARC